MRVDFYLLGENKVLSQVVFALINKGHQASWRIGIHLNDTELADELSNKLWTQIPNSFMPNQIIKTSRCQSSEEAIMLFNHAPDDINTLDYFINCTGQNTTYNKPDGRLADIVQFDEESKVAGRRRYSDYKQQQCELNHHKI